MKLFLSDKYFISFNNINMRNFKKLGLLMLNTLFIGCANVNYGEETYDHSIVLYNPNKAEQDVLFAFIQSCCICNSLRGREKYLIPSEDLAKKIIEYNVELIGIEHPGFKQLNRRLEILNLKDVINKSLKSKDGHHTLRLLSLIIEFVLLNFINETESAIIKTNAEVPTETLAELVKIIKFEYADWLKENPKIYEKLVELIKAIILEYGNCAQDPIALGRLVRDFYAIVSIIWKLEPLFSTSPSFDSFVWEISCDPLFQLKWYPLIKELYYLLEANVEKYPNSVFYMRSVMENINNICNIVIARKDMSENEIKAILKLIFSDVLAEHKKFLDQNKDILKKIENLANNKFKIEVKPKKCISLMGKDFCISSIYKEIKSLSLPEIMPYVRHLQEEEALQKREL